MSDITLRAALLKGHVLLLDVEDYGTMIVAKSFLLWIILAYLHARKQLVSYGVDGS